MPLEEKNYGQFNNYSHQFILQVLLICTQEPEKILCLKWKLMEIKLNYKILKKHKTLSKQCVLSKEMMEKQLKKKEYLLEKMDIHKF